MSDISACTECLKGENSNSSIRFPMNSFRQIKIPKPKNMLQVGNSSFKSEMMTISEEKIESSPKLQTKEWIGRVVIETFNELVAKIIDKNKFHPSELINKDASVMSTSTKIYDFINPYHSYCKLCEQHFYSRSVGNDINSFFQKHVNTAYHRQIRAVFCLPDETQMFSWEEKFVSGRCNICDISGLNSYILDTTLNSKYLMKLHRCCWDLKNRETNEKVLKKLNLLKKYCSLKIFREKYIKTINGRGVCLLCMTKLPWSEEEANYHLSSDIHFQNFFAFAQLFFKFSPRDILNGFNLETLTKGLITLDAPNITEFQDSDERKSCVELSNNDTNPYPENEKNFSFSPKHLGKFLAEEETDFIHNNECLLCNETLSPGHLNSKLHISKSSSIDETSFSEPEKYLIYCQNRKKRIQLNKNYERLERELKTHHIHFSNNNNNNDDDDDNDNGNDNDNNKIKQHFQTISREDYFKSLFKKKADLVRKIFVVGKTGEIFCNVCDQYLSPDNEILHLSNSYHKSQEEKWVELNAHFANERFAEPFLKVKNIILCLVCGTLFDPQSFFSHLKGGKHTERFEWYCNLKVVVPISSAFTFNENFSCFCNSCSDRMNNTILSLSSLKATLHKIKSHWPCPKEKRKNEYLKTKLKIIYETKDIEINKNQNLVKNKSDSSSVSGKFSKKNSVDFKKVEKTVESILSVCEIKIMSSVLVQWVDLLKSLNNKKLAAAAMGIRKRLELEKPPSEFKEATCRCGQSSTCSCILQQTAENEEQQVKEKSVNILKNRTQKSDNSFRNNVIEPVSYKKRENMEDEDEVLIIEGLSKSQRRHVFLCEKFKSIGKIRYSLFKDKKAILALDGCSLAEMAVKVPALFKENVISVTVSTIKDSLKNARDLMPVMNKDLVLLLQDPQNLMDFSLNLILEAIKTFESPLEKKRENLVCSTIIDAVSEGFPLSRCYPFGSRLSGLTLNNSDLDVFLDCGDMYEGFENTSPSSGRKIVNKVAGFLKKNREIAEIIVVDRARVPIVSFLHKPTLMRCDLSFKNGLSVQNTLLIKHMISLDWRVRPLILFLKQWMKKNRLHGPPHFSSYAIAMLVINYLEQLECPLLPTIESLQKSYVGKRTTIGGWDCSINLNKSGLPKAKSKNNDSFLKLLLGLFEFYAKFDYEAHIISPLTGNPLPREVFSSSGYEKLPMSYKRHILNIPMPMENLVNSKICICIVDPFDLSHILTKSLPDQGLQVFRKLCEASAMILKNAIKLSG